MSFKARPVRRVVTGNDEQGRSRVLFDSAAPLNRQLPRGGQMTDCWVFRSVPVEITGTRDDGNQPFNFEPPHTGAHFRYIQSPPPPTPEEIAAEAAASTDHASVHQNSVAFGNTGDRGGASATRSRNHKTESVDYGFIVQGQRILCLDETELVMSKGDIVVQIGNFHAWDNRLGPNISSFVMMGGTFDEK